MDALNDERGDIITSWLVQMLLVLAVIGVLVHEGIAIGINRVTLDDAARQAAREAAGGGGTLRSPDGARRSAEAVAAEHGAELVDVQTPADAVIVTLSRPARTLLVHRLGPVQELGTAAVSSRADWGT